MRRPKYVLALLRAVHSARPPPAAGGADVAGALPPVRAGDRGARAAGLRVRALPAARAPRLRAQGGRGLLHPRGRRRARGTARARAPARLQQDLALHGAHARARAARARRTRYRFTRHSHLSPPHSIITSTPHPIIPHPSPLTHNPSSITPHPSPLTHHSLTPSPAHLSHLTPSLLMLR